MQLNKQSIRIIAGLAAIILLLLATAPNIYKFNSNDGVVNGRIIIVRSPLSGILHFAKKTEYGTVFKESELIAAVINKRADDSTLHALKTEKATLDGRVLALDKKIAALQKLNSSLDENITNYKGFLKQKLSADVKQAEHTLEQEKAENARAKSELESGNTLSKQNAIPRLNNEKFAATFSQSSERMHSIEWNIVSLQTILQALDAGSFLGDSGNNDAPYSKQRMDQLVVEISLAESVRDEAKARLAGINIQIEKEEAKLAKFSSAEVRATSEVIVWRMPASDEAIIAENNEIFVLLDCKSVFLDVSVSETQFANIKPGDKIRYKLLGSSSSHVGEVIALRGSGSVLGDIHLAAELNKNPRRDFRVWIKIAPDDLALSPENFYQIGRRVEAKIPRKWNIKENLLKFTDVF